MFFSLAFRRIRRVFGLVLLSCLPGLYVPSAASFGTEQSARFEAIDVDDESRVGNLLEIEAGQVSLQFEDGRQSIALERLQTLRNCTENPFLGSEPSDLISGVVKLQNQGRSRQKRPSRPLATPVRKIRAVDKTSQRESYPVDVTAITLTDGSRLIATSLKLKDQTLKCRLLTSITEDTEVGTAASKSSARNDKGIAETSIPLRTVDHIRFGIKSLQSVLDPPAAWTKRTSVVSRQGDQLVVGVAETLDAYGGIVQEITDTTVSFIVDGETLPVPKQRVFGILFHPAKVQTSQTVQTNQSTIPSTTSDLKDDTQPATLIFWDGTQIFCRSLTLSPNQVSGGILNWTAASGVSGSTRLESVDSIEFNLGQELLLADLEPVVLRQNPPIRWARQTDPVVDRPQLPSDLLLTFRKNRLRRSGNVEENVAGLGTLPTLARKQDRQQNVLIANPLPDLEAIRLDGTDYHNGLSLSGGTILEYSLPESFTALRGVAGIDDRIRPNGRFRLVIQANDELLCDMVLSGLEYAKTLKFDLPAETRRLRIAVDFLESFVDGASLSLADIKLIK